MKKIDGKYQVLEKLGEGFGGAVYLVEASGKKLALKQLRLRTDHAFLSPREILDNFKEEFSTLTRLNHPHILRILDFGFDPKENLYYFTTEYIQGKDIFEGTRQSPPEEIEELFVQVLRALSYLHSQRVYHLDIKPMNILVEENSQGHKVAKLIDFGLAAFRKKGVLAGSPLYISPEAILQEPLDGRADLYSLGVTWYTCLKGKNPFNGKDLQETLSLQKVWLPPPLSDPSNNIPSYLDPVLEKLLKKNPVGRYHHPDQVIRDLNWGGSRHYPLETAATALAYLPGKGQLIGRREEWAQLIALFERVFISRSDPRLGVIISGPTGTGKSRLLRELKYHAQLHTIAVLEGTESLPESDQKDCIILIDDADENTLSSIERWMLLFHRHSVLIVLAGPTTKTSSGIWHHIALKNFDRPQVSKYIGSVLGVSDPPSFLVEELHGRTEGNPLFLTELLQSLIHSHQLFDEQGRWSASRLEDLGIDFEKFQVPQNMTEFCRKKFEGLPPGAQRIFLSVCLAKAPLNRLDLAKLEMKSDGSEWKLLLEQNFISVDPLGMIRLVNPNFRDWVAQGLDHGTLSSIHQSLAELFQADSNREDAAWYHSGFGLGTRQERLEALLRFGDSLFKKNRWSESAKTFEAAIDLATEAADQVEVRLRWSRSLFRTGQHGLALRLLEEIDGILKKEKENPRRWQWVQQTLRELASIYIKEGRLDLAHESLNASRVILQGHQEDEVEEMILENFKASLLLREEKLAEAAAISEATFRRWLSWPLDRKALVLNNELASIYLVQGKFKEAKEFLAHQAEFYREVGHTQKQATALYGLALCCYSLEQHQEAVQIYQTCAELSRKTKNEELLFRVFNELGNIAFLQMDWKLALEHYQHALDLAQYLSDVGSSIGIAINLALVLQRQGDANSAGLYLKHVIDALESHPSLALHQLQFLIQGYLALGKLHLEEFQWTEARDAFRDALHLIKSHAALESFRFSAMIGLVQADLQLKRGHEAKTYMNELVKGNFSPIERQELEKVQRSFESMLKITAR